MNANLWADLIDGATFTVALCVFMACLTAVVVTLIREGYWPWGEKR